MLNDRSRSSQNSPFSLAQMFRRFRGQLLLTFWLLLIENALNVLQPFAFGLAINDLLEQSLRGTIWIVVLYVSKLLLSFGRRLYDTRIYSKIYSATAVDMIQRQTALNAPISAISVRSSLVKELIDFFEVHLTQGFTAFVSVIGAVLMLLVYNGYLFAGCLSAAICVYFIFQKSERLTFRFNRDLNDELEQQISVIETGSSATILNHFQRLAGHRIQLSNLEAVNFGLSELLLFALVMFSLFVSASGKNATPGGIFAVLSYVFEFAEGIYALPLIFQQTIRINEISQRLSQSSAAQSSAA